MKACALWDKELADIFDELLAEYSNVDIKTLSHYTESEESNSVVAVDIETEKKLIAEFLVEGCKCKNHCQALFTAEELFNSRDKFRSFSWNERNHYLLGQLHAFARYSEFATNARTKTSRKHQTFGYRINADRPVCREAFLFYHGETIKRLKRLQKSLCENGFQASAHGNKGRNPSNAHELKDLEDVGVFILNVAANHGLPDPGRDVRKGKGKLRILLPSVMNYTSVHQLYVDSMNASGGTAVGYGLFLKIWQKQFSYIAFNNPKSDLCLVCENFKKKLNQIAAILDEEKEKKLQELHQEALDHLKHAQRERLYYRAHAKLAQKNYEKLVTSGKKIILGKANFMDTIMHYSWDFAQQLQYPFEDQQVGPIYFKVPRKAQLFGVCCEGIPLQINYLIDEADFLEKNANTVISLLDHFFSNHGLGEKSVYLTADNCVGQNKNNALIQYLMYRTLTGLHDKIELSFLVVGHTKFSPDGYFGLVKHYYRRSQVYTYEQLANVIKKSSKNKHNICQSYCNAKGEPEIIYHDWSSWLARYFKSVPNITSYHHFRIDARERGKLFVKKTADSSETSIDLIKKEFISDKQNLFKDSLERLIPSGLSAERQWYLYDQIRMHIPDENDKNKTCPRPKINKPQPKKQENLPT
jgi:hypothetical protein